MMLRTAGPGGGHWAGVGISANRAVPGVLFKIVILGIASLSTHDDHNVMILQLFGHSLSVTYQ